MKIKQKGKKNENPYCQKKMEARNISFPHICKNTMVEHTQ
jgi:hypothetical protein